MSAKTIQTLRARVPKATLWAGGDTVYDAMQSMIDEIGAPEDGESIIGESHPDGSWLVLTVKRVRS